MGAQLLDVMSTRLFPKGYGADAYDITGIASRCDYVILSDVKEPRTFLVRNVETSSPRHVFISMRSPYVALKYFVECVLPDIREKFVLISGSEDITVPNQVDRRFRKFDDLERECISRILKSDYLSHWFCENLDDDAHPLMSPIPLGLVFKENYPRAGIHVPEFESLNNRPMRILCAHRVRDGGQWDLRKLVTELALSDWSEWCTVLESEVSEEQYIELIKEHAFVLCVEGGGLDPSPKAWQTILHGSIPIIRRTALKSAYSELPVAIVPSWDSRSISKAQLQVWYEYYADRFEDASFRHSIVDKLSIDYWWCKIQSYERSA